MLRRSFRLSTLFARAAGIVAACRSQPATIVGFATDGAGTRLPAPVSMLIAANWDLGGTARVFSRDDATGAWSAATWRKIDRSRVSCRRCAASAGIAAARRASISPLLARICAASSAAATIQRSRAAAAGPRLRSWSCPMFRPREYPAATAICASAASPNVTVASTPRSVSTSTSGSTVRHHIGGSSIRIFTPAIQNGTARADGDPNPSGQGKVLLAAVEGSAARIVRVDPRDGGEVTKLDLPDFVGGRWAMPGRLCHRRVQQHARLAASESTRRQNRRLGRD